MSSNTSTSTGEEPFPWLQSIAAVVLGASISIAAIWKFSPKKQKPALSPEEWRSFPLISKTAVSPNTAIYTLALPNPTDQLGLPIGQHISIQAESPHGEKNKEGKIKQIQRSYTPISGDGEKGRVDLMIKTYPSGNVSLSFDRLKVGDKVMIKGPKGQMKYHSGWASKIGMIAGGTGITPMLQIIRAALSDPNDKTVLSLIYANVNPDDILLRDDLDELAERHAGRFKVYYVLNNPPPNWPGGVGFVTKDIIDEHLPHPTRDGDRSQKNVKTLLCGPPPMITAMKKALDALGYEAPRPISKMDDEIFCF